MRQILAFALLLSLPLICSAEFSAQVDRTTISVNETVTLTLFTDSQVDTRSLDLSALANDFEILGTSPQSSLSIINGRQRADTRWVITLLPETTGQLTIPSFSLNGESTSPITINVQDVSRRVGDSPITAQLEVEDANIYVNEELIVTISLITSPEVSSLSGEQLNIVGADTTLLDQRNFSRVVDGENWQVNQWQYAVYSRSAGPLRIPAQTFSGVVGAASRSPFDRFSMSGRRILARTEPLNVEVLSPPADEANWLPARELNLEVVWSGNPNTLEVGEPMTRTIALSADGQQAAALPPLTTEESDFYKVYADQPQLNDQPTSQTLTSERRDSAAIVPSQAGDITFPEIRLPWWDIESETWQEAVLPAETIQVAAASASASSPTPPPAPETQTQTAEEERLPASSEELTADGELSSGSDLWKWTVGVLMALSLYLAIDNLRLRQRPNSVAKIAPDNRKVSEKQLWQTLMNSVKKEQPATIRTNILAWADQQWPENSPHTLHKVRDQAHEELGNHLRSLEGLCAGHQQSSLDREGLQQELQSWQKRHTVAASETTGSLPELYPRK
jgi:hypothetical protein